jgi:hypothetical protein
MQTANIMLDLSGETGNQIPKRGVTAAEIAVLIAIHGESAVHDIEPLGDVPLHEGNRWTNRYELDRLRRIYGRAKNGEDTAHVNVLFPGAAARVFETLDELRLPDEFYKPTARAKANPLDHDGDGKSGGAAPPEGAVGLETLSVAKLKDLATKNGIDLGDATKKADIIAKINAAAPADDDEPADVVDDMADVTPPAPEPKKTDDTLFA